MNTESPAVPNDPYFANQLSIIAHKDMTTPESDLMIYGEKKEPKRSKVLGLFAISVAGMGYMPPAYRQGNPNFRTEDAPPPPKKTKKQLIAEKKAKKQSKKPVEQIPF